MARKGARSRTHGRKPRSTGTKAETRVASSRESQAGLIKNLKAHACALETKLVARTHELGEARGHLVEALEQRTATSEVLQVISNSPGELQPVFDAMLANATRLCEAKFGVLLLCDLGGFRTVALHNAPPAFAEERRRNPLIYPAPGTGLRRLAETKQVAQVADMKALKPYIDGDPFVVNSVDLGGYRTVINVPMLKENNLVGAISIYRQEVQLFTDKQIELVQNFAAQAVIAIENTRLLNELRESLQQQTATADVLKVISRSTFDIQAVLNTLVGSAARLCQAENVQIFLRDGEVYRLAAHNGFSPEYQEYVKYHPITPGRGTLVARTALEVAPVHIPDVLADPEYTWHEGQRLAGFRAMLGVPLLREGSCVGAMAMTRATPQPFTTRQIELVITFADQAVIAIENARLFDEVDARTRELSEALEQQTATSEVLSVISRSPGELEPVFQKMLENATGICGAKIGILFRYENSAYNAVATLGVTPAYADYLNRGPIPPGPTTGLGRVASTKQTIHIVDTQAEQAYAEREPLRVATAELGGARSLLNVPMLKEGELIGAIGIYRQEVRPFTDKQIELVTNFAHQAVIAIENTRLLAELRESLQQQTATANVLKVISRSTFDLQTVLDTLVESAARLCDADMANIWRPKGISYYLAASYGVTSKYQEALQNKEYLESVAIKPSRGSIVGRTLLEGRPVHVFDVQTDAEYDLSGVLALGDYRTTLGVPLLREGTPIGVLFLTRTRVDPFTQQQIELVATFADQAVIAIENVRLFDEVQKRTEELSELLERQTATSEVLRVISGSPTNIQPVLDAILYTAGRLCASEYAIFFKLQDGKYHVAGSNNAKAEYVKYLSDHPISPDRGSLVGRTAVERRTVHIPDCLADREYTLHEYARIGKHRSMLGVPLLRDGVPIGVLGLLRTSVTPFTEKQIELVTTFADQAVIAIENVRLFDEVQARTRDLSESLHQQTATADVLKVISRSTFDLQTVLDTLTESAARLCDADMGAIARQTDESYFYAATYGYSPDITGYLKSVPHARGQGSVIGRTLVAGKAIQIQDVLLDSEYSMVEVQKKAGFRTVLGVPLLREGSPIGVIALARSSVRPFTDKQIELVETFADQAVIAIENVRLFEAEQARTRELSDALEQQTATSEVLRIISSSPGELEPVFQAMLENATRICEAGFGTLNLYDGDVFRIVAQYNVPPAFAETSLHEVFRPHPTSAHARVVQTKQVVHIDDLTVTAPYREGDPAVTAIGDLGAARTIVVVPMLKDNEMIGTMVIYRQEVRPFTDKQVELLTNFASQAVIAIENTRLLKELRQRTDDLTESLQQQTATADVLKVISRSAFDLQAVFETVAESSVRLCEADRAFVFRFDGELLQMVVALNAAQEFAEWVKRNPIRPGRHSGTARAALERRTIHVPDVLADPEYSYGAKDVEAIRTILGVPILKGDDLLGVLMIYRLEVRPFTDKQIALVETFADQAAIAIENVRLFDAVRARTEELSESLQQQTATADVLKVISRSTFDLQTVLQTLVESAARLCDAEKATITRQKGGVFFRAEAYGFSAEFIEYVRTVPVEPGRGTATGRALLEGRIVHIPDVRADPEYTFVEAQRLGDFRTILGVPMLREGVPVGVLALTRSDARPFTEKQIELVSTFADQAAIAIENVRLFESVEARTRDLAKSLEDLRTAQNRLVQTEKLASLGQLTAGIAHEIKNPLNFVNNFSAVSVELIDELREALDGAPLDDRRRGEINELADMLQGNLDKVVQHGKRADSIVKNMLLHSRQGSGEHRPVDINALVEESLNLAYHGARAEKQGFNITLERSLDPAAGEVDLFPQEITRVLLNLISNGFYAATRRKAEANGGNYEPILSAATRSLGDGVEIRIRDNGTGIPPEVKEKMFNPFFTTKPAGEGTGLGLSLSYDIIVKQHGGSIEVDTKPGEFTEFRITLPRGAATIAKSGERT